MAKVLVVGGAGYVGSQTAKTLHESGHVVTVFDNLSTGHRSLAGYGAFVKGDILDRAAIRNCLATVQPDAVMHFAARSLVGESVQDPAAYYHGNVVGTWELLEAMRAQPKLPALIFSSTCSVYGVTAEPITEESALAPANPYARTKRAIELMLEDYAAAYGLRYSSLRYFNAAGCDPDGKVGELHEPESHLIPRLLLHVLDPGKYPVQIFGDDYPTQDGTCVRDYVHVVDLARAHLSAMDRLLAGKESAIFNLGSTRGSSVKEVIAAVEKATGAKLRLPVAPRRAGDPPFLVAGGGKAKEGLGWEPKHDLDSMVRTAWAWTKEKRQ